MLIHILALLIGIVAGLRAMTAPAAITWAAKLGWLPLQHTPLGWLGYWIAPFIATGLAAVELATDQLPFTPSRLVPMQFGARLFMGGLCGAAIGMPHAGWTVCLALGLVGAVVGTLGGHAVRARLAAAFGHDLPAALLEDVVAIGLAACVVYT